MTTQEATHLALQQATLDAYIRMLVRAATKVVTECLVANKLPPDGIVAAVDGVVAVGMELKADIDSKQSPTEWRLKSQWDRVGTNVKVLRGILREEIK